MNAYLKGGCLAIYLLAVLGSYIAFPFGIALTLKVVAVTLVAAHARELLIAFGSVRKHPGPLIDSIALTLLFWLLHWKPLAKRS